MDDFSAWLSRFWTLHAEAVLSFLVGAIASYLITKNVVPRRRLWWSLRSAHRLNDFSSVTTSYEVTARLINKGKLDVTSSDVTREATVTVDGGELLSVEIGDTRDPGLKRGQSLNVIAGSALIPVSHLGRREYIELVLVVRPDGSRLPRARCELRVKDGTGFGQSDLWEARSNAAFSVASLLAVGPFSWHICWGLLTDGRVGVISGTGLLVLLWGIVTSLPVYAIHIYCSQRGLIFKKRLDYLEHRRSLPVWLRPLYALRVSLMESIEAANRF